MAGKITTNSVVLGDSITDTQNFVLKTNVDGTATLARGALGALGTVLTVDASSNVGIGTATPASKLEVAGELRVYPSTTPAVIRFGVSAVEKGKLAVDSSSNMLFETAGAERMRIDSSGGLILAGSTAQKATGTTWSNPSDQRLKDNIRDYVKGLAELMQVRVREWEYNGKGGTTEGAKGLGVIADEIMMVLPETVDNYNAKLNADDVETTSIKRFDATEITWLLVKTVQELKAIVDAQAVRIAALES